MKIKKLSGRTNFLEALLLHTSANGRCEILTRHDATFSIYSAKQIFKVIYVHKINKKKIVFVDAPKPLEAICDVFSHLSFFRSYEKAIPRSFFDNDIYIVFSAKKGKLDLLLSRLSSRRKLVVLFVDDQCDLSKVNTGRRYSARTSSLNSYDDTNGSLTAVTNIVLALLKH